MVDKDVGRSTQVKMVAGHNLLGDHRPARFVAALQHDNLVARLRNVCSAHKRVVARTDDEDVAIRHGSLLNMAIAKVQRS